MPQRAGHLTDVDSAKYLAFGERVAQPVGRSLFQTLRSSVFAQCQQRLRALLQPLFHGAVQAMARCDHTPGAKVAAVAGSLRHAGHCPGRIGAR
jgi:hypothetical protein